MRKTQIFSLSLSLSADVRQGKRIHHIFQLERNNGMNQTDVYYRALAAYRREVGAHRSCNRETRTFAEADGRGRVTVKQVHCIVDEEWIKEIEKGLSFIEKAIKEERQFIYSNGEVIPIEKVKNVSKDSVEHLARHAELITREIEGEDLIPDSLYTVERLSDYAVYENRFLYMLLCYLRDFVSLRYRNILDLTNRYDGCLEVERSFVSVNRTVNLRVSLEDERNDDAYLREHNPAKDLIDRMDLILKTILSFLATPLMESAGKAAMLKPPITKTNVLKMDNNFKGAVALYDYIIAYEGDGYTVEHMDHVIDPFRDDMAEEMADVEILLCFLTYRYGLNLGSMLRDAYEADEIARRSEELRLKTEQMDALRRRLEREGQPVEAYILELEKHVRALQNEANRMQPLYAELEEHKEAERALESTIQELKAHIAEQDETLRTIELAHAEAMHEALTAHRKELDDLQAAHTAAMTEQYERHVKETADMRTRHAAEVSELNEKRARDVSALQTDLGATKTKLAKVTTENAALREELTLTKSRLMAQRALQKDVTDDEKQALTEQANFEELEKELEALLTFYKQQWSLTKRKIRKDLLNSKYIKGLTEKE